MNESPTEETRESTPQGLERISDAQTYQESLRANGYEAHAEAYGAVIELCKQVHDAGGRGLLVGGFVRDAALGQLAKDFDIEIYGLTPEDIERIVGSVGKYSDVGKAFGILKLHVNGVDVDVSLPRTDSKVSDEHRGFRTDFDPHMSIEDAARRRDFTMNAMAADPLTGELFDPFGGREDLAQRTLRVTDKERFQDDALRVLRAMQFVGRFGLSVAPEDESLMRSMAERLPNLSRERIGEEWRKLLLKAPKPSLGLMLGKSLGVFEAIHPELTPLDKTPQEAEWHPEGDVWMHTLMAVDRAAEIIRREELDERTAWTVMVATLGHDFGKPAVTEFIDGRMRALGHDQAGMAPMRSFLDSIGADQETTEKAVRLVANHLAPSTFYTDEVIRGQKVSNGAINRLAERLSPATIEELVHVAEADHLGCGPFSDPEIPEQLIFNFYLAKKWLLKRAHEAGVHLKPLPNLVRGRDLLALGLQPGKPLGEIVRLGNRLRDEREFTQEQVLAAVYEANGDAAQAIHNLQALLVRRDEEEGT